MSSKKKTLCDYKKSELKEHAQTMAANAPAEVYLCLKCARLAGDKELLCKPRRAHFAPAKKV